jgi:hypothetical protein
MEIKTMNKIILILSIISAQLSFSASPANYVQCFSQIQESAQAESTSSLDVNQISEKYLVKVLKVLPKFLEDKLLKYVGAGRRDLQALRTQANEGRLYFEGDALNAAETKLEVARKTHLTFHPADDRYLIVLTPEGKLLQVKLQDKEWSKGGALVSDFYVRDDIRNYYISVNHNSNCKSSCDNYFWLMDSHAHADTTNTFKVKHETFPMKVATEIKGKEATDFVSYLFEEQVKYGVSKLVGIQEAARLGGETVFPDPNDHSTIKKASFIEALKSCENDLKVIAHEKELLKNAIALLSEK